MPNVCCRNTKLSTSERFTLTKQFAYQIISIYGKLISSVAIANISNIGKSQLLISTTDAAENTLSIVKM